MQSLIETGEASKPDADVLTDVLTDAVGQGDYRDDGPRLLEKGAELGRYVILRKLGAGGMGTVYVGYDPELDRRVALKMLRGATSEAKRRALLREAQAMAKLRHPNVVAVHDVGDHEGQIYVAMEFVEGVTLGAWIKAERRSWRELLAMFLLAGEGLRAAHERELIHRDFKPDNVMVSSEGQARVMDFGLARPSTRSLDDEGAARSIDDEERDHEIESISGSVLTEATIGRVAGTPAYMAPEQVQAEDLGPAADQFSFCVSVWEGLCGERPFEGRTLAGLYTNTSEGRIRPPPAGRMPRWLERILRRGLAPEPKDRWASMAVLLSALDRGRRRWRWQAALAGVVALALVVVAVVREQRRAARERDEQIEACELEGAAIDAIWNDEARGRLEAGLLATKVSFAQDSVDRLVPWLDEYRDAWSSGRAQACRHGAVERDWDEELLDRSTWCFEDRRLQLEATVEQLATLDKMGARRAVRLASYLDPVQACLDPNLLRRLPVPPTQMRGDVLSIREALAEVDRMRHGGRASEALDHAKPALARAEALGWPPLIASARFLVGRSQMEAGRHVEADVTLTHAYFEAQRAGSAEVAFRAARSLMMTNASLQRYNEAKLWSGHADVIASTLEDPSGLDEAEGHYLLTSIHLGLGDYEAAIEEGEAAVAMRTKALGAEHPITVAAMRNLGQSYLADGRAREALALFERAAPIWEDVVGRLHPQIAVLADLRGEALLALGRVDEARVQAEESVAIYEQVVQPNHPELFDALQHLGETYAALGRLDEAEAVQQRVLVGRIEIYGPDHASTASSLLSVAALDLERGHEERALERCAEALEILESARGADDRQLMTPLLGLGDAQTASGEFDAARESYTRALTIGEQAAGVDDGALVPSLTKLAELGLATDDVVAALGFAERAVAIVEREGVGPREGAGARFALARALVANGDRREVNLPSTPGRGPSSPIR